MGWPGSAARSSAIVTSSTLPGGQTASRGYIGLATMIFGNWRPTGLLGGATLFGFTDALQLLGQDAIPALFLFVAILLVLLAAWQFRKRRIDAAVGASSRRLGFLVPYLTVDSVTSDLVTSTPYLVTCWRWRSLRSGRPPAHAGLPYRSGTAIEPSGTT